MWFPRRGRWREPIWCESEKRQNRDGMMIASRNCSSTGAMQTTRSTECRGENKKKEPRGEKERKTRELFDDIEFHWDGRRRETELIESGTGRHTRRLKQRLTNGESLDSIQFFFPLFLFFSLYPPTSPTPLEKVSITINGELRKKNHSVKRHSLCENQR